MLKKDEKYTIYWRDLNEEGTSNAIFKGRTNVIGGDSHFLLFEFQDEEWHVNPNAVAIFMRKKEGKKEKTTDDERNCKQTITVGNIQRERGRPRRGTACPYSKALTDPRCSGCPSKPVMT